MDILVYKRTGANLEYQGFVSEYEDLTWTDKHLSPSDFLLNGGSNLLEVIDTDSFLALPDSFTLQKVTAIKSTVDSGGHKVAIAGKGLDYIHEYRPARKEFLAPKSMDKEYPDGWEFGDKRDDIPTVSPMNVLKDVLDTVDGLIPYGDNAFGRLATGINYAYDVGVHLKPEALTHYYIEPSRTVANVMYDLLYMAHQTGYSTIQTDRNGNNHITHTFRPIQYHSQIQFSQALGDYTRLAQSTNLEDTTDILIQPHPDGVYYASPRASTARMETVTVEDYVLPDRYTDHEKRLVDFKGTVLELVEDAVSGRVEIDMENLAFNKRYEYGPHADYFVGDILRVDGGSSLYHWDKFQVMEYVRTFDSTGEKAYPTLKEWAGNYAPAVNGDVQPEDAEFFHPLYIVLQNKKDLNHLV